MIRPTLSRYYFPAFNLLLFGYVLWFRTHGVSETFWLYADQVRDWTIALKPFSDLPLVGPPSLAGGNTAGPVYYWFLWFVARVVGPWFDYLPHAGGIGIAILLSVADAALFHALARRLRATLLAAAIVLIVATAGPDATLSATIWNPPVAIALMKIGLAVALLVDTRRPHSIAVVAAILWLSVQAHTTVLPVVIAALVWLIATHADRRVFAARVAIVTTVIAILQAPWLIDRTRSVGFSADTPMAQSVVAAINDPLARVRLGESAVALLRALAANARLSIPLMAVAMALGAGSVALIALVRDSLILAIAIGPLLCAIVLFAIWQGPLNENYWYLPVALPAALCLFAWVSATARGTRSVLVSALLILVLVAQPSQAQYTWTTLRTPIYGALVRASRSLMQSRVPVQDITTTFAMPPGTSPSFIYNILGGRLDPTARQRAVFAASGRLILENVDRIAPH